MEKYTREKHTWESIPRISAIVSATLAVLAQSAISAELNADNEREGGGSNFGAK